MKRCVLVAAGQIHDYERVRDILHADSDGNNDGDFFIFCDGGLRHAQGLGVKPDIIAGDFDSCDKNLLAAYEHGAGGQKETYMPEIIRLPCEKDDTDTFYAVKLALERGFENFVLLGAMGGRFDHAFGNVSILLYLQKHGKKAELIDDYSVMKVAGSKPLYINDDCSFFSLLTVAGSVSGVTIKNAKYPLENAELSSDFQLGISNEVLPGKVAEVSVKNGLVLVVIVR